MGEIVNRVKNSSLITIDVSDFYDGHERINLEISDFLDNGILIEKHFREKLKDYDWSKFNNKYVMTNLPREEEIYLMSEEDKATWFRTRLAKLRLDRGVHEDL